MKILVLNGSARPKSNTLAATKAVLAGLESVAGAQEVEIENMTRLGVKPCYGCDACRANGGFCALDTTTNAFADRVLAADVLVLATPVYWWGMSAQLKLGIDKLYCKGEAGLAGNKRVVLVAVGADEVEARQYGLIEEQVALICDYLNWQLIGTVRGSASAAGEIAADEQALAAFKTEGERIAASLA